MNFPPPELRLNGGRQLPSLGFGTWRLDDAESCSAVQNALAAGYRLIDTAARHENESGVGRGIEASRLPRTSVVVATKLHDADHGCDAAWRAFDASAARLGMDYVDLYLIHWPMAERDRYVELGLGAIPKSGNPTRIAENLNIVGFSLDAEDLRNLATLDGDHRQGEHPDSHLPF